MRSKIIIERIPRLFASLYEKATRTAIGGYYAEVAEEVVTSLRQGRLLDLGTGPGYLPIEIVKRSQSIRVDGIDLSAGLIGMARINAAKAGVAHRLHFESGNAAMLRFNDDSYEMVISTGMLHMLREPVKVLRECRRVLKPGGEAWIYDPARVSSQLDIERWKATLSNFERVMCLLFRLYSMVNPARSYDRKQITAMIIAAGFTEYRIQAEDNEIRIKLKKE
ncbi:MAG: class I SAM-dependent methyltransferase [Deltaproteobacteria bacterium]|nr:class I SAM-dependent methyltransferase [Deltaproteobacteria bacterium]